MTLVNFKNQAILYGHVDCYFQNVTSSKLKTEDINKVICTVGGNICDKAPYE